MNLLTLLDSEAGKRRLLTVEIPVMERYNSGRAAGYNVQLVRLGSTLVFSLASPSFDPIATRIPKWGNANSWLSGGDE